MEEGLGDMFARVAPLIEPVGQQAGWGVGDHRYGRRDRERGLSRYRRRVRDLPILMETLL